MTAMIDESTPASMVQCPCGKLVAPTVPGGNRPRPHHDDATNKRCVRYVERTAATCKRCGGTPTQPLMVRRGRTETRCASHVFHPQTWTVELTEEAGPEKVGNPAACGEILGVSGEQWQKHVRWPEPGSRSRGPEPDGYDLVRRTPYWRLATVREFRDQLPSRRKPEAAAVPE